ncbi:cupin domain-containing protein [Piscinibacter sp. Jin2]|uniref:Cupin domain-containing protein n=1 Tax=Aquariibacter lacus TaxID=2801332 RepID=A0A9X0XDF0_9BURK|nr:cupin domain-containing protein [Piscinibacter lacus]MBL0718762.1 cupin domain-containing protein [Piscinibacter lacus]
MTSTRPAPHLLATGLLATALLMPPALRAEDGRPAALPAPQVIDPAALPAFSPPGQAAIRARWVTGAEAAPGLYALRVELDAGARLPPHTHPDARLTTVLEGTLWVGFGATADPAQAVAVPAGSSLLAPAGVPHWVWAREGAVRYQEHGAGPTATRFLAPPPATAAER